MTSGECTSATSLDSIAKKSRFPAQSTVERLLVPFWENGQHSAIPSIEKQKVFVEEQRRRFADIENYPCDLSDKLRQLRDDLVKRLHVDNSGWQEILNMPEPELYRNKRKDEL